MEENKYCLKISQFYNSSGEYLSCHIIPVKNFTSIHKLNGYGLFDCIPSYNYDVIVVGETHRLMDLSILQDIPTNCCSIDLEGDFELTNKNYEYLKYFKHIHPHIKISNFKKYREWYDRITTINAILK